VHVGGFKYALKCFPGVVAVPHATRGPSQGGLACIRNPFVCLSSCASVQPPACPAASMSASAGIQLVLLPTAGFAIALICDQPRVWNLLSLNAAVRVCVGTTAAPMAATAPATSSTAAAASMVPIPIVLPLLSAPTPDIRPGSTAAAATSVGPAASVHVESVHPSKDGAALPLEWRSVGATGEELLIELE
jgi:hypothetical protein